jgi:hypothetical protein
VPGKKALAKPLSWTQAQHMEFNEKNEEFSALRLPPIQISDG